MTQLYLILALLLATLVAVFAVQNAEEVTVRFLVWTFQSSVVVVILISAGLGVLLTALISLPQTLKARRRLRESEARLKHQAGALGGSDAWEATHGEE
ncbi:MAG: lipopolysaccharide assembly LapA domain-containing protein [Candidatus Methylomirabilales bacterium]